MLWKIVVVVFGTVVALLIASSIWGNIIRGGADYAVDVALVLRSPYWWLMNAVIVGAAGWLLKHWL